jgi:hypothetical protein
MMNEDISLDKGRPGQSGGGTQIRVSLLHL